MILGIDYGLKNIGLALAEAELADPYETVRVKDVSQAVREIAKRVPKLGIDKIIIGLSEGQSKNRALAFGGKLQTVLRLPVEYIDETLSTYEAATGKRKDKTREHAKAAAIILQRYLDSQNV